jgi:D-arabinitol dehydrogenase (NADP+)
MKAVVYTSPRDVQVRDVPDPMPGPEEVLLRVEVAGMCGTDLHIQEGALFSTYPLTPGHEIVGTVVQAAEGAAGPQVGRRVVADNTVVCGGCRYCKRGQPLFCRNFYSLGINGPGGFAEYVAVRAEKCFDADGLDPLVAVTTEPLACVVHGTDVLGLKAGSDVLVFGAGPTGLLLAQLIAHGGGARVTVAAPSAFKLALARSYGIDRTVLLDRSDLDAGVQALAGLSDGGYDAVVDATGSPEVLSRCLELARDGGTVLVYGMASEEQRLPISPYEIFRRELTVKGSFGQVHCFDRALAELRSGRVRSEGMVTHTFPLEDFETAIGCLRDEPSCLKVALTI